MNYTVYMHTNKANGKVYIGQTARPPEVRWGGNGIGYNTVEFFWRDIQTYGWDGFEHTIVASGLTKEQAFAMEEDLIIRYDATNPDCGYNLMIGHKHSPAAKQKLSTAASNRSDEWKQRHSESIKQFYTTDRGQELIKQYSKPVDCEELDKVFSSATAAARELHLDQGSICSCVKGKLGKVGGYHWRYAE